MSNPEQRLLKRIVDDSSGCLLWTGSTDSSGYGTFRFRDRTIGVHRAAYLLWVGEIPEGMCVCHTCDVRICVNPEHLFLGTNYDNVQDKVAKGRAAAGLEHSLACLQGVPRGEDRQHSKMTNALVTDIRYGKYVGRSNASVGRELGVSAMCISYIRRRLTWSHVP